MSTGVIKAILPLFSAMGTYIERFLTWCPVKEECSSADNIQASDFSLVHALTWTIKLRFAPSR